MAIDPAVADAALRQLLDAYSTYSFGRGGITSMHLIGLTMTVVRIVETYKNLRGPGQKKALALYMIHGFVKHVGSDQTDIVDLIDTVASPAIDALVMAANGELFARARLWCCAKKPDESGEKVLAAIL